MNDLAGDSRHAPKIQELLGRLQALQRDLNDPLDFTDFKPPLEMRKALLSILPVVLAFHLVAMPRSAAAAPGEDPRLQWFLDDRFGMFIHWGVYSGPAGEWKGRESSAYAEWLMENLRIPVAEYESEIAAKFNPVEFDAEEWVRLAKRAGMRYIVITTKHHDGFAMFHSKVSTYNIVDATPFDRDPIKELAEACAAAGIRLCFYYSHAKDWHHPGGEGNHWEHPDASLEDFAGYLDEKVFPQVEELLTRYGPVGLMWFDTPKKINPGQSRALVEHVRSLQPDCLVNSRVAHIHPHIGDYLEMGDNSLPAPGERFDGAWETSATLAAVEKRRCPAGLRFDRSGDIANGGASGSKTT